MCVMGRTICDITYCQQLKQTMATNTETKAFISKVCITAITMMWSESLCSFSESSNISLSCGTSFPLPGVIHSRGYLFSTDKTSCSVTDTATNMYLIQSMTDKVERS